jgi:AraC-like DNA-binding protein
LRIVALLPDRLLETVRIVAGGRHGVTPVRSVADLVRALDGRIDVLIVDPQGPGRPGAAGLAPALRLARAGGGHLAVIAYTSLSSASAHDVVALGVRHVVLYRVDDGVASFRELIETAPADALAARVLAALSPALACAPPELRRAIGEVFYAPASAPTVGAFRRAAGMPRMTFERALARAGFASPRRILWAARALRVFYFVRLRRWPANVVAVRLGYATPRQMAEEFRRISGYPPSRLPAGVTPSVFVATVVAGILAGPRCAVDTGMSQSRRGVSGG